MEILKISFVGSKRLRSNLYDKLTIEIGKFFRYNIGEETYVRTARIFYKGTELEIRKMHDDDFNSFEIKKLKSFNDLCVIVIDSETNTDEVNKILTTLDLKILSLCNMMMPLKFMVTIINLK